MPCRAMQAKLQEEEEWKKNKEGLEQLAHNHAQVCGCNMYLACVRV